MQNRRASCENQTSRQIRFLTALAQSAGVKDQLTVIRSSSVLVLICLSFLGLTGCESTTGTFAGLKPLSTGSTKQLVTPTDPLNRVALRPITGPPASVAERMRRQLNQLAQDRVVNLFIDPDVQHPHTLHVYLMAQRVAKRVYVTYVSDVVNAQGERVERVTGEEVIEGASSTNTPHNISTKSTAGPWEHVAPALTLSIANKVITSLVGAIRPVKN